MDRTLQLVKAFNVAFDVETPLEPTLKYAEDFDVRQSLANFGNIMGALAQALHNNAEGLNKNTAVLRLQLIQEELGELAEAMACGDLVATLDALVDLRYVLDGTILSLGFGKVFAEAFEEVHRSNMSKLEDGKPIKNSAGRVVKGKNYFKPDLLQFFIA